MNAILTIIFVLLYAASAAFCLLKASRAAAQ